MLKTSRRRSIALLLVAFLSLTSCDGKLDTPSTGTESSSGPPSDGIDLSRVTLHSTGSGITTQPPQPLVSLSFRADMAGTPLSGPLQREHLIVCEGSLGGGLEPLPDNIESFANIEPWTELPHVLKIVLVLDVSSSIAPSDFTKVRAAAKQLVAEIAPNANKQIAIHTFADAVRVAQPFTGSPAQLNAAIDSLRAGVANATNLYGAAIHAFEQWTPQYTQQSGNDGFAILVTDGRHNADSTAITDVEKARGNGANAKRMFVIGVGDRVDTETLKRITGNPQWVVSLDNYEAFNSALLEAYERMQNHANSFYQLSYASTRLDGGDYQVKLVVNRARKKVPSPADCNPTGLSETYSAAGFEPLRPTLSLNLALPGETLPPGGSIHLEALLEWSPYNTTFRFSSSDTGVAWLSPTSQAGLESEGTPNTGRYRAETQLNSNSDIHQGEVVVKVTDDAYGLSATQTVTIGELFLEHFGSGNELFLGVGRQRLLVVRTPGATKTAEHTWDVFEGAGVIQLSANDGSEITVSGLRIGRATIRIRDLENGRNREIDVIVE